MPNIIAVAVLGEKPWVSSNFAEYVVFRTIDSHRRVESRVDEEL